MKTTDTSIRFCLTGAATAPSEEDDLRAAREAVILAAGDGDSTVYAQSVLTGRWDATLSVQSALIALRTERAKGAA